MPGEPWTQAEKQTIRYWYPRGGPGAVREKLMEKGYDRTRRAIISQARNLHLQIGVPYQYISVTEVTKMAIGVHHWHTFNKIRDDAKQDGVLFHACHSNRDRWSVPEEWAFDWLDDLWERRELTASNWLSSKELCEAIGVTYQMLLKARDRGLGRPYTLHAVESIEARKGLRGRWYYNPSDVERFLNEYQRAA
jgi:hypothetical protein